MNHNSNIKLDNKQDDFSHIQEIADYYDDKYPPVLEIEDNDVLQRWIALNIDDGSDERSKDIVVNLLEDIDDAVQEFDMDNTCEGKYDIPWIYILKVSDAYFNIIREHKRDMDGIGEILQSSDLNNHEFELTLIVDNKEDKEVSQKFNFK